MSEHLINTAFIERLNAAFRQRLSPLVRRGRPLARHWPILQWGMDLVGTIYNFCTDRHSLRLPSLVGGHKWLYQTPAMVAGLTDHCWTVTERMWFHVPPTSVVSAQAAGRPSRATKIPDGEVVHMTTIYCGATVISPS